MVGEGKCADEIYAVIITVRPPSTMLHDILMLAVNRLVVKPFVKNLTLQLHQYIAVDFLFFGCDTRSNRLGKDNMCNVMVLGRSTDAEKRSVA